MSSNEIQKLAFHAFSTKAYRNTGMDYCDPDFVPTIPRACATRLVRMGRKPGLNQNEYGSLIWGLRRGSSGVGSAIAWRAAAWRT
jgi:hypothetical protein